MELKELAQKRRFTDFEKQYLRELAKFSGINFIERTNCQSCFSDLAIQIIYEQSKKSAVKNNSSKYILKPGVDVIIAGTGQRINAATMTDELAEKLIKAGFKKYFVE